MGKSLKRGLIVSTCIAGLAAATASFVSAQPEGDKKAPPAGMELPPGWTTEDMQACMMAGTPGKMHELLQKSVGTWTGKTEMWMSPVAADAMVSDCTYTITSIMDGRYIQCSMAGEMPGMGPMTGLAINGYDNVSQKFVGTWIDNHSSGIMQGTGDLSADGKTRNWKFSYNCPVTKKVAIMRQIETVDGDSMSLQLFANDPKSNKEYKCIQLTLKRQK